ncbi:MAG: archease [Candidatus Moranbacteria bacterium]|nr:archease [Candidatus Moranbacteria bacterium]
MKSYKLLPHTADTRLYVESDTLAGLFEAALEGMSNIIKSSPPKAGPPLAEKIKNRDNKPEIVKGINLTAPDTTSLLIDFLSEVLTYSQEEKAVFRKADIEKLTDTGLETNVYGKKVDGFDEDIKAVTYHEAEIKKNEKGNYETVIIFDI